MKIGKWTGKRRWRGAPVCCWPVLLASLLLLLTTACSVQPPSVSSRDPLQVSLTVEGETYNLTTEATNVRELLAEAGVTVAETDQVSPPPFTPLSEGLAVSVVRVTEKIEVIEESLPFERKLVRSETMDADDPPRIVQGGHNGLQEITVRTVFHDGVEVERQQTQVTVLEEAQDEIVMIGVGSSPGDLSFEGVIAYNSGGNALLLRGSTLFPEQLNVDGRLDGRVFQLSPNGNFLLYTQVMSDTGSFNNSLWLLSTESGAEPRPLGIENVLWAEWNPSLVASMEIAYTTGNPVDQPPGWEANNDLWVANVFENEAFPFNPRQIIEAYPATYGWWGGNFSWSPDGRHIAYAYADEVGVIDLGTNVADERRIQLHTFTEFNTRADWVWVPTLTWGPQGRYLAFSSHAGASEEAMLFEIRVADLETGVVLPFVEQAGMWSHPHWSASSVGQPGADAPQRSQIAFLKANNPLDSLRSPYNLWLMDQDGSNQRQIYPPIGENSRFSLEQHFMTWGPGGQDLAFVFDNSLYLFSLERNQAYRVNQDDTLVSRPSWAPYGAAVESEVAPSTILPTPDAQIGNGALDPEDE